MAMVPKPKPCREGEVGIGSSLAHTKWNCVYHVVFIPKYRRKIMYGKVKRDVREILKKLCGYKGIEILEGAVCAGHVHSCAKIPPKSSVSACMGCLKGKSALVIFDRHLRKRDNRDKRFWAKGYYVDTVGRNEEQIRRYIKDQEETDKSEK
jgi:putative transposase